ncbi:MULTISPECIES: rRNA maturation RNase YbeY [Rothia]|uniref:Endoribonuclease YbeY n=1 Tax=Rothia nasimurium TaxID=85336 RepID=A0A1Y1RQE2_9MICC|nr:MULTISPECIES: rRNA maturation RNase YbeY [Rothia]ORC22005.1 rRNA maturation RNase YbeY [Rothia nasimurium]
MNLEFEIEEVGADAPQEVRESFAAVDITVLESLVAHAFDRMHVSPETELSISVVGMSEMERLHLEWMGLSGPTDVMSFPMDELAPGTPAEPATGVLGDIVLCPPVAARQGAEAGHSTLDELCLLTTHGILHCLGYDHATAEEEAEMFAIQRSILEEFLGRPAPVETRH